MLGPSNLHLVCQILHRHKLLFLHSWCSGQKITYQSWQSDSSFIDIRFVRWTVSYTPPTPQSGQRTHNGTLVEASSCSNWISSSRSELHRVQTKHVSHCHSYYLQNLHDRCVFVISARFVSPRGLLPPESLHARLFHGYQALPQGRLILKADHFHVDVPWRWKDGRLPLFSWRCECRSDGGPVLCGRRSKAWPILLRMTSIAKTRSARRSRSPGPKECRLRYDVHLLLAYYYKSNT